MNSKIYLLFLGIVTFLLAGSVTANLLQLQSARRAPLEKIRSETLADYPNIRKVGNVIENNTADRWIIIAHEDVYGSPEKLRLWLTPGASIVRVEVAKISGVIEEGQIKIIGQKDIALGETVYVVATNSLEHNRIETGQIIAGDLLPLAR